ncbi:MAG: hypothetical protein AAGH68_06360 [Pseudomonadota bacterium]
MSALFIVRAEVPEADRAAFDHWYETEHLPDAMAHFGCNRARRGWSELDPGVHVAAYDFPDAEKAKALLAGDASPEIKAMIAEFDRVWQGRVKRTRELVILAQSLEG